MVSSGTPLKPKPGLQMTDQTTTTPSAPSTPQLSSSLEAAAASSSPGNQKSSAPQTNTPNTVAAEVSGASRRSTQVRRELARARISRRRRERQIRKRQRASDVPQTARLLTTDARAQTKRRNSTGQLHAALARGARTDAADIFEPDDTFFIFCGPKAEERRNAWARTRQLLAASTSKRRTMQKVSVVIADTNSSSKGN